MIVYARVFVSMRVWTPVQFYADMMLVGFLSRGRPCPQDGQTLLTTASARLEITEQAEAASETHSHFALTFPSNI